MLITGLGLPAVPEQMDAPEKSMPSADTGGGGTAFSEIISRVSEKQEEKGQEKTDKPAEEKTGKELKEMEGKEVPKKAGENKTKMKKRTVPGKEPVDPQSPVKEGELQEKPELSVDDEGNSFADLEPNIEENAGVVERLPGPEPARNMQNSNLTGDMHIAAAGEQVQLLQSNSKEDRSARRESKKERPAVKVVDLRRKKGAAADTQPKVEKSGEFEKPVTEDASRERQFTLIERDAGEARGREPGRSAAPQFSRNDQSILFKHLQETVNDKIVRQTGIILKDNTTGELRLVLKPEKMGTVRIRLELQDNHIAGRIFVDNSSVKDVFDQNLEALYRAFRENGYETSGLNVTVGNGNGENSNKQGRGIPKGTIRMLEDFVPLADEVIHADSIVNLVV